MNNKLLDYADAGNSEIVEFVAKKFTSVRCWFQKINKERRNIELKTNRQRKMLSQLEVETIENLSLELKSTLRVPR